ncbi:MAG: tricarballylate utilization 4Fe-4S protein TcuB [Burkholderiaceae bacterium]|jgi:citrate/tricarballylate utilization protein|nr:tricarballylate utilization 4Fe-4S protein TcuB [Burkholderiaceae bacterium]
MKTDTRSFDDAHLLGDTTTHSPAPLRLSHAAEQEVARQLTICNACRYCEGFCAVFPAMTRRLQFNAADAHYLANLCHNCGACLHACQYAPPHEFALNLPRALARARAQTYQAFAWPAPLAVLYRRNGAALTLALAAALAFFLALGAALNGKLWGVGGTSFYGVFPHNLLVGLFAPVFLFAVGALAVGVRRFLRDVGPVTESVAPGADAIAEAAHDALTLKYLDGGHGDGCPNADDAYTPWRRVMHHCTFYGFMLCFAATALATVYHYAFGWPAPYDWPSLPKLLGAAGGAGLLIGLSGQWHLNRRRDPAHGDAAQKPMDLGFIALLWLIAASGLLLWWARAAPGMAALLCVHLGAVMALFLTLPYGKFAHGIYRAAALLRHAVERRRPNPVAVGAD